MVRFLKTIYEIFDSRQSFARYLFVERLIALAYIPASMCVALGALGGSGIVPYAMKHEWIFFLSASIYLSLANARDLNHSIRCLFLRTRLTPWQKDMQRRHSRCGSVSTTASCTGGTGGTGGEVHNGVSAQMQMGAAIALTIGSLSLLNASVIALTKGQSNETELCRRQFAAAFGMMVVGAAANSASSVRVESDMDTIANTRMVVSFQHVVSSAAFFVGGVQMLPSMKAGEDGTQLQNTMILVTNLMGSVFVVLSAFINYFHTMATSWYHEDLYDWDEMMSRRERRKKRHKHYEAIPLMFDDYNDEQSSDQVTSTGDGEQSESNTSTQERRRRRRRRRRHRAQQQRRHKKKESAKAAQEEQVSGGVMARLRQAVRRQGLAWFRGDGTEGVESEVRADGTRTRQVRRRWRARHSRVARRASTSSTTTTYGTDSSNGRSDDEQVASKRFVLVDENDSQQRAAGLCATETENEGALVVVAPSNRAHAHANAHAHTHTHTHTHGELV